MQPRVSVADLVAKKLEPTPDMVSQQLQDVRSQQQIQRLESLESSFVMGIQQLIKYLDGKTTKTEVVNHLQSIGTPDVLKVVSAIEQLDKDVLSSKLDIAPLKDVLASLEAQLKQLPKDTEQKSLEVSNLSVIGKEFDRAIRNLKLEPNLVPIQTIFKDLLSAVKNIKLPEVKPTDVSGVEQRLDSVVTLTANQEKYRKEANKLLKDIANRPIGGGGGGSPGFSFKDATGNLAPADTVVSGGKNAVAVVNPDGTNIGGGGGGGTQYTDGGVTAAHPIGTIPVFDKAGVITAVSSANPLPTTATITGGGDASAANQTTEITKLTSIDGKTPALGQALSASSVPVVLPAAQITTLTPPAAITGFATSTKQSDGTQKTQIVDGAGNVIGATSNAIDVNIKSGAASGTQYAEGATAVTGTGTLSLGKSGTTIKAVQTDASGNIRVDLSQTAANATAIKTDGSAVTQPVSGTVTATGPLTDTQLRATAIPVSGTFWQTTQPVSLATNTPTLAAGTAIVGKVGIDQTTDGTTNKVFVGNIPHVIVDTAPSTAVTNAGTFAVQATLGAETTKVIGTVRTADGSGNLLTSTGNALDVNLKTSAASNISTNTSQINGVTPLMGNGASGTGAQRVTIASDSTGQVAPAANATATGTSISYTAAMVATKVAVNASAGNLYGWLVYNPNTVVEYIQLFNVASASVTLGTTAPTMVIPVPAGGWSDLSPAIPITFGTALTAAATTTASGLTAPATGLVVTFFYK